MGSNPIGNASFTIIFERNDVFPSSRGLGHQVLILVTWVRIPLGMPFFVPGHPVFFSSHPQVRFLPFSSIPSQKPCFSRQDLPERQKKGSARDMQTRKNQNGGGGRIRTSEGMAGRFTVYCI